MAQTSIKEENIAALLAEATPGAAARLREIAEATTDKETRKEARRALYRLSQAGVVPPERSAPTSPQMVSVTTEPIRAFVSAFDGAGNTLLMLLMPDPDGGSPTMLRLLCNDLAGIRDLDVERRSRRETADLLGAFEKQLEQGLAFAEVESGYARWLLWGMRTINQRLGTRTPAGFLDWLPRIGEPPAETNAVPLTQELSAGEILADNSFSHDSLDLFKLIWFETWFFEAEESYPWLVKYVEAGKSEIELPKNVMEERSERVFAEAAEALLTPEMRARYVRRLEISADVLWRRGEQAAARMALYHAYDLDRDVPVAQVNFAMALTKRSIAATYQLLQEARQDGGATGEREQDSAAD